MSKVLEAIRAALKALAESQATGPRAESIQAHLKSCESNAAAEVKASQPKKAPEPNKAGFARVGLLAVTGLVLWLACWLSRAESFAPTNIVNNAVVITGFPTNSAGTSELNQKTGTSISVANQQTAGFYASGYCTANSTITETLVRSGAPTRQTYQYDATGTNVNGLNWESSSAITLTFTVTPGPFYWFTNLDTTAIGGAQYIGLYSITNITASGAVTNFDAGLSKKILPIRYP